MSKILRQSNVFRRKIYDIPEEVGMDIVEALDMLEIKHKKNKVDKNPVKSDSEYKKSSKSSIRKVSYKKLQSKVIQKLNREFIEELSNEVKNKPEFSSAALSHWLRNISPAKQRNILFRENVTSGHLAGIAQTCNITLTPQVLTTKYSTETKHIILEEIQLVQLDEFYQICTIFASNSKTLSLENFPEGRLQKFILILSYIVNKPKLIFCFNWNFVLKRQKCPRIQYCFPVNLTIESKPKMDQIKIEDQIEYKIEHLGDGDVLELLDFESSWTSAFWILK